MKRKLSLYISRFLVTLMLCTECIPAFGAMYSYANPQTWDVLVRFHGEGDSIESRKAVAAISQKEAIALLDHAIQSGRAKSYESFYISNAMHVIATDAGLVEELTRLPQVESVHENGKIQVIEPIEEEEMPIFFSQGELYVPDYRDIEWGVLNIHADKVWDDFQVMGEDTVVGIIDSGVNYNLPALKDKFIAGGYKDFVDGLAIPQADSANDHGTHVAGTIVGEEGKNLNRIGVAPKAKFISARALGPTGGDISDLLAAAQWMLEKKPDVINNSWGGSNDDDRWFADIVDAWNDEGIIPVFAAGNTSDGIPGEGTISNPGNYLDVLSVAAVDKKNKIGRFSNKGPSAFDPTGTIIKPEISAPGVQVRSVNAEGVYVSWNGTSMAAPHVAGVVALIRSAAKKAGVEEQYDSLEEVRTLIMETASPLVDHTYPNSPNMAYGYGLINAYDAVAKVMGRGIGSIEGAVFIEGADTEVPKGEFTNTEEAYLGRNVDIRVKVQDDISIRSVKLEYRFGEQGEVHHVDLVLQSGKQNDGIYGYSLAADRLQEGDLQLKVSITDYANHTVVKEKVIEIKPGMSLPWVGDFDDESNPLAGFITSGSWGISAKKAQSEPELPEGVQGENKRYLGINAGMSGFEKRVDSYVYLPPINLRDVGEGIPTITLDMYNGFTGISTAKLQASTDDKNWEDIHQVLIRPDIMERQWEKVSFSLEKYKGSVRPVLLRFYFYGHDADEGIGWYLDNIEVKTGENAAPNQVQDLKAKIDNRGLELSFIAGEETDLRAYRIERSEDNQSFREITRIDQSLLDFRFINPGEDSRHPSSHFRVEYRDTGLQNGKKYYYRVYAIDSSGNESAVSQTLEVLYSGYHSNAAYDFEENDGGFTSEILEGNVNDWEWGIPQKPDTVTADSPAPLRWTWEEMAKNPTKVWGTKLHDRISKGQDSALYTPWMHIQEGEYFYFDSFNAQSIIGDNISFTVEVQERGSELWSQLVSRETIMQSEQLRTWFTLESDLEEYSTKEVRFRFRVHTQKSIWIDDYNIGWYIDNVHISQKKIEFAREDFEILSLATESDAFEIIDDREEIEDDRRMSVVKSHTSADMDVMEDVSLSEDNEELPVLQANGTTREKGYYKENHIPIKAEVKILETGSKTYSSEIDGYYYLPHATGERAYTLEISAYGYQKELRKVHVSANRPHLTLEPIVLRPAKKVQVSGLVSDTYGNALADVSIYFHDDVILKSDTDGRFHGEVYAGEYDVRFVKDGYITWTSRVHIGENATSIDTVYLQPIQNWKEETTDYGYVVEKDAEGNYVTIAFRSGLKGMAVKYQSPHKGGILKSADIFLVNNEFFNGDHIKFGVLSYDTKGRLRELVPIQEYENLEANAWNTINFLDYSVQTDEPIYIVAKYDDEADRSESMGVLYDVKASDKAKAKSFVYDGAFTKTAEINPFGAYAVKATWLYDENAPINAEKETQEGASNPETGIVVATDGGEFVFDRETQTITKYLGESEQVRIPAQIDGVDVKAIGEKAFLGSSKETKLRMVSVPEGVESIGKNAFQGNEIRSISLPESLKEIGEGAFMWQSKYHMDDQSFEIKVPKGVKIIKENTFYGAGTPLEATLEGVEKIEANAFASVAAPVIHAPALEEIADEAFGRYTARNFTYPLVYTKTDTHLVSKDHEYLINPIAVSVRAVDARDHEHILKKEIWYGQGIATPTRNYPVRDFYQIGKEARIRAEKIRIDGVTYLSADAEIVKILQENESIEFHYYHQTPRVREPIVSTDTEILGFAVPNHTITVQIGGRAYETQSNDDGFFALAVDTLSAGERVQFIIDGNPVLEKEVRSYQNEEYIIENGIIKRYLGDGGATLKLPIAGRSVVKEIGDFAFYGKSIQKVILPDAVTTIGSAAFMKTGLQQFTWELQNIDDAKLRNINEYAFRDNSLTDVRIPYLAHVIQTGAFENNTIQSLHLGVYTGHIGDKAFRNNKLKTLELPATIEEIGTLAFADNQLEKVVIPNRLDGYTHGLEEIPALAFSGNRIKEFIIPDTIKYIAEESFAENMERFIIRSDVETIVPSRYYDVLRSDGTLLKWEEERDLVSQDVVSQDTASQDTEETVPLTPQVRPSKQRNTSSGSGGSGGASRIGSSQRSNMISKLPPSYTGLTKVIRNYKVPNDIGTGTWTYHKEGYWTYQDALGQAKNAWRLIYTEAAMGLHGGYPYAWYHFDEVGRMRTGFYTDAKGDTYFLDNRNKNTEGAMLIGWQKIGEHWYYFNPNYGSDMGKMLKNTITPDGYKVNEKGIWVK